MRKIALLAAAALVAIGSSTAAYASNPHNPPPPPPTNLGGCTSQQVITSTTVVACNGYYAGNILDNGGGQTDDLLGQQLAVQALTGSSTTPTFTFQSLIAGSVNGQTQDDSSSAQLFFGSQSNPLTLFGNVIIGMHFGNITDPVVNPLSGRGGAGNLTIFYLLNLTTPTTFITLDNPRGWSNAYIYQNGTPPPPTVPEPATWAMMLVGFGAAGMAMRRSRKGKALLSQIA